jgi:hypothetical protein
MWHCSPVARPLANPAAPSFLAPTIGAATRPATPAAMPVAAVARPLPSPARASLGRVARMASAKSFLRASRSSAAGPVLLGEGWSPIPAEVFGCGSWCGSVLQLVCRRVLVVDAPEIQSTARAELAACRDVQGRLRTQPQVLAVLASLPVPIHRAHTCPFVLCIEPYSMARNPHQSPGQVLVCMGANR